MNEPQRSVDTWEVSLPMGIIVEKRKSSHPWADWIWKPVSVVLNANSDAKWVEMLSSPEAIQYMAGTLLLTLHRKDTEALRANLMLPAPELYVVLREEDDAEPGFPLEPHLVTASAYDAQDMTDAGDDIVEKVPMPEAVAAFIQAFVEQHHVEEKFIKRKRDKLMPDEHKFGKEPIYSRTTRH